MNPRFESKVYRSPSGCHLWTASINVWGYGQIRIGGKVVRAHRLAWEMVNGPIPEGMYVCHKCDKPACVNPDHLFLGTHAENMVDMKTKGRGNAGSANTNAKLIEADILEIRGSTLRRRVIAQKYGVSLATVRHIRNGTRWGHVKCSSQRGG